MEYSVGAVARGGISKRSRVQEIHPRAAPGDYFDDAICTQVAY